jgi:hypothetical protein
MNKSNVLKYFLSFLYLFITALILLFIEYLRSGSGHGLLLFSIYTLILILICLISNSVYFFSIRNKNKFLIVAFIYLLFCSFSFLNDEFIIFPLIIIGLVNVAICYFFYKFKFY